MAEVSIEITVNTPLEQAFAAVSTTDGIRGWWTDDGSYDGRLAGRGQVTFGDPPVALVLETTIFCKDEEIIWRCLNGPADWIGTNISWVFESQAGGTKLMLNHAGIRITDANKAVFEAIWRELLAALKRYVESGAAAPVYRKS